MLSSSSRPHFRLQARRLLDDLRGAAIQQLLRAVASWPCALKGIRLGEYVHEERRDLLRAIALLRRRIARQLDPVVLPQA
jgi:hypothetical protein